MAKRRVNLTDAFVRALKVPAGKSEAMVFDSGLRGFGVRKRSSGATRWIVQATDQAGRERRETIGSFPETGAEAARTLALNLLRDVRSGVDVQAQKAARDEQARTTFAAVRGRYLNAARPRLRARSFAEVERHLTAHWAALDALPLHLITRRKIADELDRITEERGPIAANRARANLSAFATWAVKVGLLESNFVVGSAKPVEREQAREHTLTDEELVAVWRATRQDDYGRLVRLLILTGQRREEVGGMRWDELDLEAGVWTLPAHRAKNGNEHQVPLSGAALAVLNEIPRRVGRDLVFGEGDGGFSGWSKAKAALDARVAAAGADPAVRPWRLHDLRRTAATGMADLGTLPHVVEAVLNHVSGHRAGVARIYNRATYSAEKRQALTLWATRVDALIEGRKTNVVSLRVQAS